MAEAQSFLKQLSYKNLQMRVRNIYPVGSLIQGPYQAKNEKKVQKNIFVGSNLNLHTT